MSVTSVDSLTAAVQPAQAQATATDGLGRDEFLKLLVSKLENQDPLEPAKDTEFVAQLATFSSLEQLISVNQNLEALGRSQALLINSQALGLIGKDALVEAGGELRVKNGQADTLVYAIPREAQQATLTILDAQGAAVRTIALETNPSGRVTLDWDGAGNDGQPLADGDYTFRVEATDADGEPLLIPFFRSMHIDGVSFTEAGIALVSGDREIPFETILEFRAGQS